jgi:flagellum-specific ATP synthase
MPQLVDDEARNAVYEIRELLGAYKKAEDLINIGAYKKGSNPCIDSAIAKSASIASFLKQSAAEASDFSITRGRLLELART